jgi:hypothetical protein
LLRWCPSAISQITVDDQASNEAAIITHYKRIMQTELEMESNNSLPMGTLSLSIAPNILSEDIAKNNYLSSARAGEFYCFAPIKWVTKSKK